MIAVYMAHSLSAPTREGVEQNRQNAAKWAAWLWRQGFSVECSWIVCTGELDETPENRELGLRSDCEQVKRCDVFVLCGPRVSSGMLREAGAAKIIVDFTYLGLELPTEDLKWNKGRPTTLRDVEAMAAPSPPPSLEESAARIRDALANPPPKYSAGCEAVSPMGSRCDRQSGHSGCHHGNDGRHIEDWG